MLAAQGVPEGLPPELVRAQVDARAREHAARFPRAQDEVVLLDGEPVGRLLVDRTGTAWRVVDIALLPSARGGGLGTALLTRVLAEADAENAAVRLFVHRDNPRARALYERLGFVAVATDEVYVELERPAEA